MVMIQCIKSTLIFTQGSKDLGQNFQRDQFFVKTKQSRPLHEQLLIQFILYEYFEDAYDNNQQLIMEEIFLQTIFHLTINVGLDVPIHLIYITICVSITK